MCTQLNKYRRIHFSAVIPESPHEIMLWVSFSVPSFGPMNVEANATSSTTVVVRWGEVPREHCNGQIEGYKVKKNYS